MRCKTSAEPEVIVLGGGLAGSVAACTLARQGVSVLVCERATQVKRRIGECLPPRTLGLLKKLNLNHDLQQHILSLGIKASWGTEELAERHFIFEPYGQGYILDRNLFDRVLAIQAIDEGAGWLAGVRLLTIAFEKGRWRLLFQNRNKQKFVLSSKIVIDASGRNSYFARKIGQTKTRYDNLTAIFTLYRGEKSTPSTTAAWTSIESTYYGWWYCSEIPSGDLVVALFTDREFLKNSRKTKQDFIPQLDRTKYIRLFTRKRVPIYPPSICSAFTTRLSSFASDHWIAVGDAALSLDPITSHGITMAIETGFLGACTCIHLLQGNRNLARDSAKTYHELLIETFDNWRSLIKNQYQAEKRWKNEPFWLSRL